MIISVIVARAEAASKQGRSMPKAMVAPKRTPLIMDFIGMCMGENHAA
jgi:hypothetical protein